MFEILTFLHNPHSTVFQMYAQKMIYVFLGFGFWGFFGFFLGFFWFFWFFWFFLFFWFFVFFWFFLGFGGRDLDVAVQRLYGYATTNFPMDWYPCPRNCTVYNPSDNLDNANVTWLLPFTPFICVV